MSIVNFSRKSQRGQNHLPDLDGFQTRSRVYNPKKSICALMARFPSGGMAAELPS